MTTPSTTTQREHWPVCNEREGGCSAGLSPTDYAVGYCTNCGKETDMGTQMRFHMSNGREMVEHTEREALRLIRRNDPRFRAAYHRDSTDASFVD